MRGHGGGSPLGRYGEGSEFREFHSRQHTFRSVQIVERFKSARLPGGLLMVLDGYEREYLLADFQTCVKAVPDD
jgi:hypothetical protein